MAGRVLGLGGIFLKSKDPGRLVRWYSRFGIAFARSAASFKPEGLPKGAVSVLAVFPKSTPYFRPSRAPHMLNFVVDDVDAVLRQVAKGGAKVLGEPRTVPYGRFGWFLDPDRNKIELWQPPPPRAPKRRSK